jgi:thiol-disulfide isomerase/thioredoxin
MTIQDILPKQIRAHELYGDYWFNSDPVPIAALRGQVVLLFFWDYTCNHCLRTLPYIRAWHMKYEKYGLVVVGVHSPKFPFGKNPENVLASIERHSIVFPVVMDNENIIANNYGNRFWPTTLLIDKDGFVRFQNVGEGNYTQTERALQTLLYEAGVGEELPLLMEPLRDTDRQGAICYRVTPELFAGYLRGSIGNIEGYSPESTIHYDDPKLYLSGRFYADGNWQNDRNCLRLNAEPGTSSSIILQYDAVEVNAVIKPEGEANFEVEVLQDDSHLTLENKGEDVLLDPAGRSYMVIDRARMFNVVKNREFGTHTLKLTTRSNGFALYSFTFVSCVIPELISNN